MSFDFIVRKLIKSSRDAAHCGDESSMAGVTNNNPYVFFDTMSQKKFIAFLKLKLSLYEYLPNT